MNANLLTIDNTLFGLTGTCPGPSKPEATGEGSKFHLSPDDKQSQVNNSDSSTTDKINDEADTKLVSKSPEEFHQAIHNKNESEHSIESKNTTKPKEQSTASDKSEQPDVVQNGLPEQHTAAELSKEVSPTKTEAKVGPRLAQIIANFKTYQPSQVTGQAAKPAEIKHQATVKGQLGLKTVLPAISKDQNELKAVMPGTTRSMPADKTQPGTVNNNEKIPVSAKTVDGTKEDAQKAAVKELAADINSKTGGKITAAAGKTAAVNPTIQKLNIAAVQVADGQTKGRDASTSNKSHSQGLAQILSHNNSQTQITEQLSASAKNASNANMPAQNSSGDVSADIGKQILESIQRSLSRQAADRQITVRLNPPELGKVFIKFQQQGSELTGQLEVSKAQTRFEIEQTLPQILRNLADSGINIRRLDVTLSNEQQPGQNAFGNQSLQSGGTQQQYSANQGTPGNDPDADQSNEWWASNNGYENISELQDALITDGSINLLI